MEEAWYKNWFDSPYYHMLYSDRSEKEAEDFITKICDHLHLKKEAKVWDNACGNGRHSIALAKKGFQVTGTDLSKKNIDRAKSSSQQNVEFYIHDMRQPFRINYFDCVFNLFTSFGYFENKKDNLKVFESVKASLKSDGIFVMDFFNAAKVRSLCFEPQTIKKNNIDFHVSKKFCSDAVCKTINFEDLGRKYEFSEKVSLLELNDFRELEKTSGLKMISTFGNYSLENFDPKNSERLIMIFQK
jgi:cyclopropane fatty-acyl-phospholipid synthase-like methyltransferase